MLAFGKPYFSGTRNQQFRHCRASVMVKSFFQTENPAEGCSWETLMSESHQYLGFQRGPASGQSARGAQSPEYKSPGLRVVHAGLTPRRRRLRAGTTPCLRGCQSTSPPRPARSRTNRSRGSGVRRCCGVRKPEKERPGAEATEQIVRVPREGERRTRPETR